MCPKTPTHTAYLHDCTASLFLCFHMISMKGLLGLNFVCFVKDCKINDSLSPADYMLPWIYACCQS
jgi:hypothetical protein